MCNRLISGRVRLTRNHATLDDEKRQEIPLGKCGPPGMLAFPTGAVVPDTRAMPLVRWQEDTQTQTNPSLAQPPPPGEWSQTGGGTPARGPKGTGLPPDPLLGHLSPPGYFSSPLQVPAGPSLPNPPPQTSPAGRGGEVSKRSLSPTEQASGRGVGGGGPARGPRGRGRCHRRRGRRGRRGRA